MGKHTFKPLRYRQIHLDFHTSEHIPDVGRDFDAEQFVTTLKDAHVDSVTLFARCHHGWCYYPSEVGAAHPQMAKPDLLGEMVDACRAADIETPIYITVQWDENLARTRPDWLMMNASNQTHDNAPIDGSANYQLTASWHTLCLNNVGYRQYLIDMGLEIIERYNPPGLFYDIVSPFECVCPKCVDRMHANGLDPMVQADRKTNVEAVNEQFRQELSTAIWARSPNMRLFYNCGHIDKRGAKRFETYSHLEIESLPTGPWGYDHFPVNARYAAAIGKDFLGQTGKFHTSWGEFGGYKQSDALTYECAQTVALGAKCLIGDQLHPLGEMDADTYKFIAPAYAHIEALEPYLKDAKQVSEVAILSSEYFGESTARSQPSDDGAVRVLLELKIPFDVVDPEMPFASYKVLVLPDCIPVDDQLKAKIEGFVNGGGKVLLTGTSGKHPKSGKLALNAGFEFDETKIEFTPSYVKIEGSTFPEGTPKAPFVMYGQGQSITVTGAEQLGAIHPSYFNRSYKSFCSHKHSPVSGDAAPIGAAVTLNESFAYIAYPIFEMYQSVGQPIYKYLIQGLLEQLLPASILKTNLPSGGRATVTQQDTADRLIVHLLYGAPQQRGKQSPEAVTPHPMELIEDIPALADIYAAVRTPKAPIRVYDAISGEDLVFTREGDYIVVEVGKLHIHRAVILEFEGGGNATSGRVV